MNLGESLLALLACAVVGYPFLKWWNKRINEQKAKLLVRRPGMSPYMAEFIAANEAETERVRRRVEEERRLGTSQFDV